MKHTVSLTVRFGDVDGAGIVYYPRFFNYFHIAFEEFWSKNVRAYDQILSVDRVGFPTVHVETDFGIPLRHGDAIAVEMTMLKLGRSSFTCAYRVLRDGKLCARAEITTATVNLDKMEAIPVPDAHRAALERIRDDAG
ncbi:MAG: acyl-CoA thioesterase [Deltaproteobacteria bacterium]